MMNIAQLSSMLQNLNDQQLQMEMKNPQAGVPQYLILSEMQRRQKMRADAAPKEPAPRTTVAQDITQGVAGLPDMASGGDAPGGVASFAGGGSVGFPNSSYPSGGLPDFSGMEDTPLGRYLLRVKEQMKNSFAMPDDNTTFADYIGNGTRKEFDKLSGTDAFKGAAKGLKDIDAEVGRSQASIPNIFDYQLATPSMPAAAAADTPAAPPAPTIAPGSTPGFTPPDNVVAKQKARVAASSGVAAAGRAAGVEAPAAREMPPLVPPDRIPNPKVESPEDYAAMVERNSPDSTGELLSRYDKRGETIGKDRKNAVNMALIQAGLGMMTAKGGNFLNALGEGGIGGLKAYTEAMHDANNREDKLGQMRDAAILARDAAKRGNFKLAAEIANNATARNVALHGQDVQERRADMQMSQADRQFQTQMEKLDKQLAAQVQMANARNATELKAAGIRAAHYAGATLTPKDYIAAVQREYSNMLKANPFAAMDPNAQMQMRAQAEANVRRSMGMEDSSAAPAAQPAMKLGVKGFYQ